MASDREILRMLRTVGNPFLGRFRSLTEVQRQAIPAIFSGSDVLVASATASGKTEAIVAPMVARLQGSKQLPQGAGVRLLVVAPTRALVNDLFHRLQWPLSETGWQCGRQTSDNSDKARKPHVLVTTPESFDSMLCRDVIRNQGEIVGHLLASVQGVFLDEAHLYENSARGDHVSWLLARLRRLRQYSCQKGWTKSERLQVCAGSATVSNTSSLSERLLGTLAIVIRVEGDREIQVYSPVPSSKWVTIRSSGGLAPILELTQSLLRYEAGDINLVWGAIQNGAVDGIRKVLIFVASRHQCDLLSAELNAVFQNRRNIYVSGHHGSLDKAQREEAEKMFALSRDAVLVATATLEVGVDIGDVDVIVLMGTPRDTSAFLQRIGRGGRRSGLIKIIPVPENTLDSLALSSMTLYACQGILEASPGSKRWSVFVQQVVSLIMQSGGRGRKQGDILELVESVWGNSELPIAQTVIEHLLAEELLIQHRGRLFLGEMFSDGMNKNPSYFHCNFESDGPTIPVVNHLTGQAIAHVAQTSISKKRIAVSGMTVDIVHGADEILVKQRKGRASNAFFYSTRRPLVSKSFAEHVRRALGFAEDETILYESEKYGPIWFHFGGGLYENVLDQLLKPKSRGPFSEGLALNGAIGEGDVRDLESCKHEIGNTVDEMKEWLAYYVAAGRFHRYLPDSVQTEVVSSIFDIDGFLKWACSRTVTPAPPDSPQWAKISWLYGLIEHRTKDDVS